MEDQGRKANISDGLIISGSNQILSGGFLALADESV